MKNNLIKITLTLLVFAVQGRLAWSQGFINLNFENPILPLGPSGGFVPTANAIPGWTAYLNGGAQTSIGYNAISIGGSVVSLNDTNATGSSLDPLPIQGKYSVFLLGSPISFPVSAAIGQTGQVPISTQSLTFWVAGGGFQVSFNGQPISYLVTGSTANYNIYAADISAYAGQTGELLFTAPAQTYALLDNIQFSSSPVPEPSVLALAALGASLLGFRRWNKK